MLVLALLITTSSIYSLANRSLSSDSATQATAERLLRYAEKDTALSEAIQRGLQGYRHFEGAQSLNGRLVLVDFTKGSFDKRIYVFDLEQGELLYHNYVAHGKNSGLIYPRKFSNTKNSYTSSLGFFKTAETYRGKHGLSLRLDGLEPDINHNARERAIVIHSAKYANPDFVARYDRLGRSYGCPALPEKDYQEILDIVKEGALLYIHYPDPGYLQKSKI